MFKSIGVMMDPLQLVSEFEASLRAIAQQLQQQRVPVIKYESSEGDSVSGWEVESGEHPFFEDVCIGRNPYYMGGRWGRWSLFLGVDGILWRYDFRGEDVFNPKIDGIETSTREILAPVPLQMLVGEGKPFKKILEKVNSAALKLIVGSSRR